MPGPNDSTTPQDKAGELDSFIDSSMEGSRESFLDDRDDDGTDLEEEDSSVLDTDSTDEPELPLEQPAQPQDQQLTRVGNLFADKQGNIVNSQGRIIAAKGEAARHWTNMSKEAGRAAGLQKQVETLARHVQSNEQLLRQAQEISSFPMKMGISAEDYNEGIQLLANWNKDPVGVAREVVSRTIAMGHNVTDILGKNAGDALEMRAMRQMIDEATAGQRQQEAQRAAIAQHQQQTQRNYMEFVNRYPDAELHGDAIAALMTDHQLTPVDAYHEIRLFAQRHGLDFSQPLGPQIQQARAQQPNGNGQRYTPTQRAPMVSGASGGRSVMTTETEFADPNSDWSSILNSVLRQS
jgi:flagellar hook protein FlgE